MKRVNSDLSNVFFVDLLDELVRKSETEEWYNRHPRIEIFQSESEWFVARVELDTEPDEWGWHEVGSSERFDGYETYEEAEDAIAMINLKRSEKHEADMETVGPYPLFDGIAMEDYDE